MNIRMTRWNLDDLPPIRLPAGYRLATAAEFADPAEMWASVVNAAFGDTQWTAATVREQWMSQPQYDPSGVFFVMHGDQAVSTAFAWLDHPGERKEGRVHFVGTLAEHRGKGLGTAVVLAVLHYFARRGFSSAFLETQAFRMAAIRVYVALGFVPTPRNEEEEREWAPVVKELGLDAPRRLHAV